MKKEEGKRGAGIHVSIGHALARTKDAAERIREAAASSIRLHPHAGSGRPPESASASRPGHHGQRSPRAAAHIHPLRAPTHSRNGAAVSSAPASATAAPAASLASSNTPSAPSAPLPDAASRNLLSTIGQTPLVALTRLAPEGREVLVKLEARNPGASVKDRIALAIVDAAEKSGELRPGGTIVEATSGNTGIGLAMVAAARGYRLILTMPEDMSTERQHLLRWLGAELHLTPAIEGMSGAVWAAQQLADRPGTFLARQFENPANPEVHERTTGAELLAQVGGQLDAFVAGVGTGGTLTGVGRALRRALPNVRIVAVEPARAAVLSGGRPGFTKILGLGAGFVPGVLDRSLIDDVIAVDDEVALAWSLRLGQEEGILAGISAGAAAWAAVQVASGLPEGSRVATILPDSGERYLSMAQEAMAARDAGAGKRTATSTVDRAAGVPGEHAPSPAPESEAHE